jgi:hypothetical protein
LEITGCYSGALHDAIGIAHALGLDAEEERLKTRLTHMKAVFRAQFADLT